MRGRSGRRSARSRSARSARTWAVWIRSETILAHVADGIVAVDREGKVVLWNEAAEHITGVPSAAALGRTPLEVLRTDTATFRDFLAARRTRR